jgi:hypothetical protein
VINPNSAQLDVAGASETYQSLFTVYQGLSALNGLASDILKAGAGTTAANSATQALTTGLSQVSTYVDGLSLSHVKLTTGTVQTTDQTTAGPSTQNTTYTSPVIFSGTISEAVPAFEGDVNFDINVTNYAGAQTTVPIDLSQLGSTTRSIENVVSYINSQLTAAGVQTQFAVDDQPATPQTVTVDGQSVTLPAQADNFSLQVVGDTEETVSFSAPATAPQVYVAQTSGNVSGYAAQTAANASAASIASETGAAAPVVDSATQLSAPIQQIIALQAVNASSSTSASSTTSPSASPPAASVLPGTPDASVDEAYGVTLSPNVTSVGATATGPNGALYVLANVDGEVNGETPTSSQNVALQEYDSAGNLVYSTLVGGAGDTQGLSLAVSSDGSVAVAGTVTGALDPSNPGSATGAADSFVALYNAQGEQQWATTGTSPTNNQINSVTFGANDTVYVAGQTNSTSTSSTVPDYGPSAGYVAGYSSTGTSLFNVATGTSNANSVAVDGNTLVVAGTNASNDAVVNSYTLPTTSGTPTLTATRNLGSLGTGSIAGVAINNGQVVVAGTTSNANLSAGSVTSAFSGTQDAFVAQLSEDLTPSSTDAIAYYGGTGSTEATALTVANGQVYIAGTSSGGLPGLTDQGTREGFVANVDVATGTVPWSQALDGQNGVDAPTSIAVAATGASVLDRLGLPTQTLQYTSSQLLTASTSVQAGDQFEISVNGGAASTVTISATDTPQTLAQKIIQASGYQATVTVVPSDGKDQIEIKPENSSQTITLLPGATGKDALGPLGLKAGDIQTTAAIPKPPKYNPAFPNTSTSSTTETDTYGLNIAQDFNLTTTAGVQAAQKAIQAAITTIQSAYTNLADGNQTASTKPAVTGTVPAYLSSELANYQAGLSRLTGSSSSSSASSSSSSSSNLGSELAGLLA